MIKQNISTWTALGSLANSYKTSHDGRLRYPVPSRHYISPTWSSLPLCYPCIQHFWCTTHPNREGNGLLLPPATLSMLFAEVWICTCCFQNIREYQEWMSSPAKIDQHQGTVETRKGVMILTVCLSTYIKWYPTQRNDNIHRTFFLRIRSASSGVGGWTLTCEKSL